jgi:nicotinamidase/pyrazinamidase
MVRQDTAEREKTIDIKTGLPYIVFDRRNAVAGDSFSGASMKQAIIISDMLEDFIRPDGALPVGEEGLKIIPNLQRLIAFCRQKELPIIYANDALMPGDFLFKSRLNPHGIRGTAGARIISELKPEAGDVIVHKRRFSAFFKTDLDITLREWGAGTVVIGGVSTEICVLSTAYDAVCNNFEAIVLEDCCASRLTETRDRVLEVLRKSPLYPLLRVMPLSDFLQSA